MKNSLIFLILAFSNQGHAILQRHVKEFGGAKPSVKIQDSLKAQKQGQLEEDGIRCLKPLSENIRLAPELTPWILISGLKCFDFINDPEIRLKNWKALDQEIKKWKENPGPWGEAFLQQTLQFYLWLMPQPKGLSENERQAVIQWLENRIPLMSKSQLSRYYFNQGSLLQQKADLVGALYFFDLSLQTHPLRDAQESKKLVQFALDQSENKKVESGGETKVQDDNVSSEIEKAWVDRVKQAEQDRKTYFFLEQGVQYLRELPGGLKSRFFIENLVPAYFDVLERQPERKEALLALLEKLDPDFLVEVTQSLHRRADYQGSLILAKKALSSLQGSREASQLYFIAGRSAQFLGQYSEAVQFFQKIIDQHPQFSETPEVFFRMALALIRQQQWASANAWLERLLRLPNKDRYELSARYWIVRCLERLRVDRVESEKQKIRELYPFSYYSLKLTLESSADGLTWPVKSPPQKPVRADFYWSTMDQSKWDRITRLSAHGWIQEAQAEYQSLIPSMRPEQKVILAEKLAAMGFYSPLPRMTNEAGDLDPQFRDRRYVQLSFPKPFSNFIDERAKQNGLRSELIYSLIRQESAFNSYALSTSNAMGLMQIIPPTAAEIAQDLALKTYQKPSQLYDIDRNIQMGSYYLRKMINQFNGSIPFALAAYNAGPTRMKIFVQAREEVASLLQRPSSGYLDELWMDEVPWYETSFYVKAILRNVLLYRILESEKNQKKAVFPPVLWSDLVLTQ